MGTRFCLALAATLLCSVAHADWQIVRDEGCYLSDRVAGISLHASRSIRGAPDRWVLSWVLDRSWGVTPTEQGYKQVIPLRFSDGTSETARVQWNEHGEAILLTTDLDRAFRTSQWVALGDLQVSLQGSENAWRSLMSCLGEPAFTSVAPRASATGWLLVDGDIDAGWAQTQIHRAAASMPLRGVIVNGNGGRVAEAMKFARWLRQQKLATMVDGKCASACVLAFAGGVERYLSPGGQLGLHQFSSEQGGSFSAGQWVTAETAAFFEEMGIDNDLALLGAKTSADEIRWLTLDEVLGYRLATDTLDQVPQTR